MKAQILREMKVLTAIEPEFEVQRRVAFIKTKLKEARSKALVLGSAVGWILLLLGVCVSWRWTV